MTCPSCGTALRLPAHITYLDMRRGQWILVEDAGQIAQWPAVETEATELFSTSFGASAPPLQCTIGADLKARLVFGWPALREKLLAAEAGLDDVVLELLKISVIRNVPDSPLSDSTELRLAAASDSALTLQWINTASEQSIADLSLERSLYDELAADLEPWSELKAQLEAGLFVDMNRIIRA